MTRRRTIIALMIGELKYMRGLNRISSAIVARAVAEARNDPASTLVCESAPMADEAIRLGLPMDRIVTALPQPAGHTTRLVANWAAKSGLSGDDVLLVTHAMHAPRSVRIFAGAGVPAEAIGLDLPFDAGDPDWKLRSRSMFRAYNAVAHVYCRSRGWI